VTSCTQVIGVGGFLFLLKRGVHIILAAVCYYSLLCSYPLTNHFYSWKWSTVWEPKNK